MTAAAALRVPWLTSDPPTIAAVGIVWHDEGAWTHNARNRALWGVWRTDDWNPVFIAPVFTALEYVAFREFGVGHSGRRGVVPVVSGLVAIAFLAGGAGGGRQPARGAHRQRAARHQLRIRDVESRGPHGVDDDRVHRRRLGGVRVRRAPAGLGRPRGRRGGRWRGSRKRRRRSSLAAIVLDALKTIVALAGAGVAGASARRRRRRAHARRARRSSRSRASRCAAVAIVGALRLAALDGVPLLQLADVRAAQTGLRPPAPRRSRLVAADRAGDFHAHVAGRGSGPPCSMLAIVARWRTARPAERLLVFWMLARVARAGRARLGQRSPLCDVHSRDGGARRARGEP